MQSSEAYICFGLGLQNVKKCILIKEELHMQTTSNDLSTNTQQEAQNTQNTQITRTSMSNAPAASQSSAPSSSKAAPPQPNIQQSPAKTDDEIYKEVLASNQGSLFNAVMNGSCTIYQDAKMTIMALLCIIAGFTQDPNQIDRIFRRSPLVPSWWDEQVIINGVKGIVSNAVYWCNKAAVTYGITVLTIFGPRRLADYYPDENPRYTTDDIGSSYLFYDLFHDSLKYVVEKKCWFYYNSQIWVQGDGAAMEYCKFLAAKMEEYASQIEAVNMIAFPMDELTKKEQADINKNYKKFAKHLKSRRARETILKDAQSVAGMWASASDFDKNPYLLCCENVTLDLRDISFHPHSPQDMITKMANVVYDPQARSPLWLQHIDTVMEHDVEKALYFQKCVGSALVGTNEYCCIFILYGPRSRNGKSVTMDTIKKMVGTYGAVSKPATFTQKGSTNGSAHDDDLAQLAGKRIVSIPELENTMTLSSSLVKRVTGDAEIAVRAIFEKQFSFEPQFSLFFHTNHLPRVDDMSMFKSGRIKVIPFTHFFEEHERNPHMVDELTTPENRSAILNWALEGLWRLKNEGFDAPQSVLEATGQYHQESDSVGRFITENMQQDGGYASTKETFLLYRAWCEGAGQPYGREQDFKKDLENRGISAVRRRIDGKQITAYIGWSLVK